MDIPPQCFAEYPRVGPSFLPGGVEVLPPGIHLRAFLDGWFLFRSNWRVWLPATLLFFVLYEAVEIPFRLLENFLAYGYVDIYGRTEWHSTAAGLFESFLLTFVPSLVRSTLGAGLTLMAFRQMRGLPIRVADMFSAIRFAPRLLALLIVSNIAFVIGLCLLVVPGVWVLGAFAMSDVLILDQNLGPIDAMKRSREIVGKFAFGFGFIGVLILVTDMVFGHFVTRAVLVPIWEPWALLFTCLHYSYFYPERFGIANPAA